MQPAAAVVADVHDEGLLVAQLAQHTRVDLAEALRVHRLDVHIAHLAAGVFVHELLAVLHPARVELRCFCARVVGLDIGLVFLALAVVLQCEKHVFACQACEEREVVFALLYLLAVYLGNDVSGLDVGADEVQRALRDDFLYLEAVALVALVVEGAESGRLLRSACAAVAGSRMRGIELAEHFAEHLGHVVVVGDVGQELAVIVSVVLPVAAVHVRAVEAVLHRLDHVLEDVLPLLGGGIVNGGGEWYLFRLPVVERNLADVSAAQVDGFAVGGGREAASDTAREHALTAVVEVADAEVHAAAEAGAVVDLAAVGRDEEVADVGGRSREAVYPVFTALKHQFETLRAVACGLSVVGFLSSLSVVLLIVLLLLVLIVRFLLVLLIAFGALFVALSGIFRVVFLITVLLAGLFFGFLLGSVVALAVFLAHMSAVVGFLVEIHYKDIVLCAPTAVTAVALTVGGEGHGLAAESPVGLTVAVAALREVDVLGAVGPYEGHVAVVPPALSHVGRQQILTVGRPVCVKRKVGVGVVEAAAEHCARRARGEVEHAELAAVGPVGYLLAVGGEPRLVAGFLAHDKRLFFELTRVDEVVVLLARHGGHVDAPHTVFLTVVDYLPAVGADTDVLLALRRVGDALCGSVVGARDEHLAVGSEGYLLAVAAYAHSVISPAGEVDGPHGRLGVVGADGDAQFLRLLAVAHRVEVTVVGEAHQAARRDGEVAYGIALEVGKLTLAAAVEVAAVHIHRAGALLEIVVALAVGRPARIAALAREVGEFAEGAVGRVGAGEPDVPRDGGDVVLAPLVLVALVVLIQHFATGVHAQVAHVRLGEALRARARSVGRVYLTERPGEAAVLCRRPVVGAVEDAPIGQVSLDQFVGGMSGEAFGCAALYIGHEYVETAETVAGERYPPAVGRPHGSRFIGCVSGELARLSSRRGYYVYVAAPDKGYTLSVGRYGTLA